MVQVRGVRSWGWGVGSALRDACGVREALRAARCVREALGAARCVLRGAVAVVGMVLSVHATASAQASVVVPLDDIAYAYIDALQARGQLRSLSMLERPYTAAELRAALAEAGGVSGLTVMESWRAALVAAIGKYDPRAEYCAVECDATALSDLAVRGSIGVFGTASTSGSRNVMLADESGGAYPGAIGRFAASGGHFVAASRIIIDNRYKDDPDFAGKVDRSVAGRVEDAYLGLRFPWVEITAGRVARNLGPATMQGLQIGHNAYTYDHVFARLGSRRFHLVTMVASLDAMHLGDSVANRYMALHRISGRWGGLEVALSEAMLYGGVGRRFEPGYLNPLNLYQLTQYNEDASGNVSYGIEASWRASGGMSISGQVLIDDFQIDDCTPGCEEPSSYGLTLSAEGLPLVGGQRLFGSYARVSNLTYRTPSPYEAWTTFGVGLGHGRSDYDELRVGLDLAVIPRMTMRPYGAYRRQGEGDYRVPFPASADYATTPAIHAGVVARTMRIGLSGSWAPFALVELRGEMGWNRSENLGHEEGAERSGFEGWVRVGVEAPWVLQRRFRPE